MARCIHRKYRFASVNTVSSPLTHVPPKLFAPATETDPSIAGPPLSPSHVNAVGEDAHVALAGVVHCDVSFKETFLSTDDV